MRRAALIIASLAWLVGCDAPTSTAVPSQGSFGLSTFVDHYKIACLDTYPNFAAMPARVEALGYSEDAGYPQQYSLHSLPDFGSPFMSFGETSSGRASCIGILYSTATVESAIAQLDAKVSLTPKPSGRPDIRLFDYQGGTLAVSSSDKNGRQNLRLVLMTPKGTN